MQLRDKQTGGWRGTAASMRENWQDSSPSRGGVQWSSKRALSHIATVAGEAGGREGNQGQAHGLQRSATA